MHICIFCHLSIFKILQFFTLKMIIIEKNTLVVMKK